MLKLTCQLQVIHLFYLDALSAGRDFMNCFHWASLGVISSVDCCINYLACELKGLLLMDEAIKGVWGVRHRPSCRAAAFEPFCVSHAACNALISRTLT